MIAGLLVDTLFIFLKLFVATVVLPTYALFLCFEKVWVERVNIYNYIAGRFA